MNGKTGVSLAVLSLAVGMTFLSAAPVRAQLPGQPGVYQARTIRVSGVGEVRVEPDLATLQFAVETTGSTAAEAGAANADLMDRVIQALVGAGVARTEIQTSGYSLYPEYVQPPRSGDQMEPPTIRGYRAMNMVSVRSRDLDGLGRLIDVALGAGANRMHGVSFEVTEADAAEAQALSEAVMDAREAAQTMATALGVQLGDVLDATTNSQPPMPFYREYAQDAVMAMGRPAAAPTPIEAGEQTIRADASVVYEIR